MIGTIKWLALDKFIEPYENEFLAYLIISDNKNPKNAYYYETALLFLYSFLYTIRKQTYKAK